MAISDGAKAYRRKHERATEDDTPSVATAVQRGELMRRSQRGDLAAREALRQYREDAHEAEEQT